MFTKLLVLFAATLALSNATYDCGNFERIIEEVNNANTTWKAGRNFGPDVPCEYILKLLGYRKSPNARKEYNITLKTYSGTTLPDEFDARKQWPKCPTVSNILDQSNCGSCWAVSTASVFSDRMCIAHDGQFTLPMSGEYLTACSEEDGCGGGLPVDAWGYIQSNGLVTGGGYHSGIGCQPYEMPPCEHEGAKGKYPPCDEIPAGHPACETECTNPNYNISLTNDLRKVDSVIQIESVQSAQEEIMTNGPIVAAFSVYEDFLHYKSGVYQHTTGKVLAGHAVRVLGWGVENGTPFWLVANSWNPTWGDNGLFKIRRGTDECGFEEELVAGVINHH